ncbi:carboxypeptidase M32 [Patulibacter brassicae]|uniref:Metal-dependent carboxypeptidase n=1 Tax=Patulibacter brassicae TaxID=1705717 RepID=A0ABU4VET3_9ACTN|nr:carboxypeptidase M32 [Patulibacter brassicae]MDX8150309.1 carboxypeptidase M32 [Patulibacter brassicae]
MTPPATAEQPPAVAALREHLARTADLQHAAMLLHWDHQTQMPPSGATARGAALGTLEELAHERTADPALGVLLDAAQAAGEDPGLLRAVREDHERAARVPSALVGEIAALAAVAHPAWAAARQADDFTAFAPHLRRHVELARRYAACFPEVDHPYDALLQRFEPGATTADLRAAFAALRSGLVPLIERLAARPDPGDLLGPFPVAEQRALALEIARSMGFDDAAWRIDEAVHPFMASMGREDVRITTKEDEATLAIGLFGVLHETGHGLYEAGVDPAWDRTTVGTGTSLGVHESQSRLWENMVGRSRALWSHWLPRARELFPGPLAGVDLDDFLRRINVVRPSLIRVDADEATYCLHVLLRFELEVALVEGSLDVDDLPRAWNDGMRDLLGVTVPSDADGVLQDVHWSEGAIGYFPTYAVGTIVAAQLWAAAHEQLPGLDDAIAGGDLAPLREWLREHVHRHGRTRTGGEILAATTGGGLDPQPLLDYLTAKYEALHG